MAITACPKCRFNIETVPTPALGQFTICPRCGACLEVIWLQPLTLTWVGDDTFVFEDSTIVDGVI